MRKNMSEDTYGESTDRVFTKEEISAAVACAQRRIGELLQCDNPSPHSDASALQQNVELLGALIIRVTNRTKSGITNYLADKYHIAPRDKDPMPERTLRERRIGIKHFAEALGISPRELASAIQLRKPSGSVSVRS
jgi:hypothetical protein